jgi:uncharacterized protein
MRKTLTLVALAWAVTTSAAQIKNQIFQFEFEGFTLNGVLNLPNHTPPKGIVLLVHGSGQTNAVEQNWYADVRETLLKAGYGAYMWDKRGCGKSEGVFDYNQSVENSAAEVIAAIHALKNDQIASSDKIGLWGISRAGWINPLVIQRYKDIKFWISVSGVDDKENFKYLLEQNLRIAGHPLEYIELIVHEWVEGIRITHAGGSFEAYQKATVNLGKDNFWLRFTHGGITAEGYYRYQKTFKKEAVEEETGLQVYVENFDTILSSVHCPVLALFGERDTNVDWRKTKSLYEKTMGKNTDLTIQSFPGCNHNMFRCETGGFYEFEDTHLPWTRCEGFLNAMTEWLKKRE